MDNLMYLEKLGGLKPAKNYSKTEVEFYVEMMPLNKKSVVTEQNKKSKRRGYFAI